MKEEKQNKQKKVLEFEEKKQVLEKRNRYGEIVKEVFKPKTKKNSNPENSSQPEIYLKLQKSPNHYLDLNIAEETEQ